MFTFLKVSATVLDALLNASTAPDSLFEVFETNFPLGRAICPLYSQLKMGFLSIFWVKSFDFLFFVML